MNTTNDPGPALEKYTERDFQNDFIEEVKIGFQKTGSFTEMSNSKFYMLGVVQGLLVANKIVGNSLGKASVEKALGSAIVAVTGFDPVELES